MTTSAVRVAKGILLALVPPAWLGYRSSTHGRAAVSLVLVLMLAAAPLAAFVYLQGGFPSLTIGADPSDMPVAEWQSRIYGNFAWAGAALVVLAYVFGLATGAASRQEDRGEAVALAIVAGVALTLAGWGTDRLWTETFRAGDRMDTALAIFSDTRSALEAAAPGDPEWLHRDAVSYALHQSVLRRIDAGDAALFPSTPEGFEAWKAWRSGTAAE
jgi:hypothetical protein